MMGNEARTPDVGTASRRTVLRFAVAGATLAIAGRAMNMQANAYDLAHQEGLVTLTTSEATTVQAIGARIWPGDADDPGAREAGTVYYIDRALAGFEARHANTYRRAVRDLNAIANARHGDDFAWISGDLQDEILLAMQRGELSDFAGARSFFTLVRRHTMEGLFADPIYGGNRDFAGWRAVGYPGPFYFITIAEQQSFEPLDMPYQSIVDL